ncbi:MAG TPA: HAD family phosphatase [Tepidisphaeraceae bacterium]|nr:HAD family phosphatase [Tepidisphaeraceae bacterium]
MRAVVFDMDGLMIDSEKVYWSVGRAIAREHGKEVSDLTLGKMMGRSPIKSVEIYIEDLGLNLSPAELLEYREKRVKEELKKGVDPMPGLFDVLKELKRSYKLGIATSAPMYLVDIIFEKLGMRPYFDAIQTSDDVIHGKPDPEIYLKAMGRLGVQPPESFVLEDSSNGARAGKRSGAYTIAVPSQYTRDQDFSFVDYVATDLRDAARHIEQKSVRP